MLWLAAALVLVDFLVQTHRHVQRLVDDLCQRDPEFKRRQDHQKRNLDRLAHGEDWIPYRKVDR